MARRRRARRPEEETVSGRCGEAPKTDEVERHETMRMNDELKILKMELGEEIYESCEVRIEVVKEATER